jgi:FKBP-type peptidyl-prolyl cis-trans isomerase
MYRVLRPGTGAKPTATSQVEIVFQTFLAAVNVPLSGEQTPAPFKVADAPIPALKETLPLMQQGTVWEMVIPPGKLGADNPQFAKQAVTIRAALSGVK